MNATPAYEKVSFSPLSRAVRTLKAVARRCPVVDIAWDAEMDFNGAPKLLKGEGWVLMGWGTAISLTLTYTDGSGKGNYLFEGRSAPDDLAEYIRRYYPAA